MISRWQVALSIRNNKAAAAEFRELVGLDWISMSSRARRRSAYCLSLAGTRARRSTSDRSPRWSSVGTPTATLSRTNGLVRCSSQSRAHLVKSLHQSSQAASILVALTAKRRVRLDGGITFGFRPSAIWDARTESNGLRYQQTL